jgi:hypothetical protein
VSLAKQAPSEQPKTMQRSTTTDTATLATGTTPSTHKETPPTLVSLGDMYSGGTYTPPKMSEPAVENAIHVYGNEVGEIIQTAVRGMGDQNALVQSFIKDRTKKPNVLNLAKKYEVLSSSVADARHPKEFANLASSLAAGYSEVARGLRTLSEAEGDTDVYAKMLTYNTNVETFASAFIPYASLFGALGVTFSPDEPGGMFTPAVSRGL